MQNKNNNLPLLEIDFIEFFVGNAKQAAYFYQDYFGFEIIAFAGLETGDKRKTSYLLVQQNIRIVLTSSLIPNSEISDHVKSHGDGVKFIAFLVEDSKLAYHNTVNKGAEKYLLPNLIYDKNGEIIISGIKVYGDTVHLFVERKNYNGLFLPGFKKFKKKKPPIDFRLKNIDHVVANVGWNQMNEWVNFYSTVMGFSNLITFDDKDISTKYTALMSKVMINSNNKIKFPINEPAKGIKKSQIEEFIEFYNGPGCQHIALLSEDIIFSVKNMRSKGVEFLEVPKTYYDKLFERCGQIDEDLSILRNLGILVDKDEEGYLLQIFTKPVMDRPTFFFEIIQRKGSNSFGKGNFKALFEAIELEQKKRGTI